MPSMPVGYRILTIMVRNQQNEEPEWLPKRIGIRHIDGRVELKVFDD